VYSIEDDILVKNPSSKEPALRLITYVRSFIPYNGDKETLTQITRPTILLALGGPAVVGSLTAPSGAWVTSSRELIWFLSLEGQVFPPRGWGGVQTLRGCTKMLSVFYHVFPEFSRGTNHRSSVLSLAAHTMQAHAYSTPACSHKCKYKSRMV